MYLFFQPGLKRERVFRRENHDVVLTDPEARLDLHQAPLPVGELRRTTPRPVLVVRFLDVPDLKTAMAVKALTNEAVAAQVGKIAFVGVVPGKLKVPMREFRDQLAARREEMRSTTHAVHFVLEGEGLFARLQRGMLSALASVMMTEFKFQIHSTDEEALLAVAAERQLDLSAFIGEAVNALTMPGAVEPLRKGVRSRNSRQPPRFVRL